MAILQLASEERVYLLDMIEIPKNVPNETLQYFANQILATDVSSNMVLAYEPRNDFKALCNTTPAFQNLGDAK